jgi:hypothetical protein
VAAYVEHVGDLLALSLRKQAMPPSPTLKTALLRALAHRTGGLESGCCKVAPCVALRVAFPSPDATEPDAQQFHLQQP